MKRPKIRIDLPSGYEAWTKYSLDLEKYCDSLEQERKYLYYSISMLEAYLQDSLWRVNPTLDEGYIENIKELLR